MRSTFSTLALLATSLLVNDVAGRFDVRKRDTAVVTDKVIVTDEIIVTEEADGTYETGLPVAIGTQTVTGTPVAISSVAPASSVASIVVPTTSSTPVAAAGVPSSSAVSSSAIGAVFVQEPKSSSQSIPASTTSAAPKTTLATVASSPAAPVSTGSSISSSNKRGLAYNDASILSGFVSGASKVSWAYNWGATTSNLPSGLEYVPMLWGNTANYINGWANAATKAIAAGSTHLLSFNEPDYYKQSNIAPGDAAAAYKTHMMPFQGQAKLGAPAVTNGGAPIGLTWLNQFFSDCSGCHFDFLPIHWYAGADNVDYFKSYIAQAYAAGNSTLPIWITEFQASGTPAQQNTFLETVIPWLDAQPYVERYAYFMASDGNLLSSGSTLSTLGNTFASFV